MGARHSKHRKYPVQPGGLHISSPYPPGRSGFEEAAVTRNNPLFSSGGGGGGGGGGGSRGGRDGSGVYRTYGNRPAPPSEEEEDLDRPQLRPEERLRRSIIRSRRGHGHRSAHREAREIREDQEERHHHDDRKERRHHDDRTERRHRDDREERRPREDREDSVGEHLSARSSAQSSARSSARSSALSSVQSSVRSSQVRAKASVHSFEFPGPPPEDPGEECPQNRQGKGPVTVLRESQDEDEEDSVPIPRPAPRTLFGMMPDVVGRPVAPSTKDDSDNPVPGKVTIEVAWRDEDEPHGRAQSSKPAGPDDLLNKTIYPESMDGSERGSISSGRLGGLSVGVSGGDSDRGSRGGSPMLRGLDPPLAGTWPTDGDTTNVPVAAETGSATGGGGGGPAPGMKRTVRWGDDAGDLPARLEGNVETSRDTRNQRWSRQLLSIRGHTLVTPDLRLDLTGITIRPAPETSNRNSIKLCRGQKPELFLKFRSRDDYRHWLTMLRAGSGQQPPDDVISEVGSDVTEEKASVSDASEEKVSVAYGENNTVNISYGGTPEPEKLKAAAGGEEAGGGGGGGLEFESWEVAEADEGTSDGGATVDLGEEACSDVSDQPITGLDAPGLAAGRSGGPIFSLDDLRSNTPPPAFADQPLPANSVRWDLEMHSPDLQRTPARATTLGVRWGRPATPPGSRFRRRSASPPASLTSTNSGRAANSSRASSGAAAASARHKLRSVETQTDSGKFGLRRAGSEWALLERGPQTASIRSERIRRAAQMFEEIAQAERAAAMALSPLPRRPALESSPQPEPEPEPELVAEQERRSLVAASRCVDAIVALGGGEGEDSDRDDESEELLWLRVKAKIAERRQKFRQLDLTARRGSAGGGDGGGTEEVRSAQVALLSPLPALPIRPVGGSPLSGSEGASSSVTSVSVGDDLDVSGSTGDGSDTLRCWTGKYIEQDEEQEILRGLGNPVLAEQKLHIKMKTRNRLEAGRAESERQKKRIQDQRDQTQLKLDQVKAKLTRDGAFERKRLETVLFRLDQSIREEQQRLTQLTRRIAEADGDIEALERRLSHLVVESDTRVSPLSPLE